MNCSTLIVELIGGISSSDGIMLKEFFWIFLKLGFWFRALQIILHCSFNSKNFLQSDFPDFPFSNYCLTAVPFENFNFIYFFLSTCYLQELLYSILWTKYAMASDSAWTVPNNDLSYQFSSLSWILNCSFWQHRMVFNKSNWLMRKFSKNFFTNHHIYLFGIEYNSIRLNHFKYQLDLKKEKEKKKLRYKEISSSNRYQQTFLITVSSP